MKPVALVLTNPMRVEFSWASPPAKVVVGAFKRLKGNVLAGGRVVRIEQAGPDGQPVSWEDVPGRPRPGAAERDGLPALLTEALNRANLFLAEQAAESPEPQPKRPVGRPRLEHRPAEDANLEFQVWKKANPTGTRWEFMQERAKSAA